MNHETHSSGAVSHMGKSHYRHLLIMTVISFIVMYVLMYAMVNVIGNARPNLNQFYRAGLTAASMVIIEIIVMRGMYHDKKRNVMIGVAGAGALVLFLVFIRAQTAISDGSF